MIALEDLRFQKIKTIKSEDEKRVEQNLYTTERNQLVRSNI